MPRLSKREFFFNAQHGICHLRLTVECQCAEGRMDMTKRLSDPRRASWDHIIPKSKKGVDAGNILLACFQCNHQRATSAAPPGAAERAFVLQEEWKSYCAVTPPNPPPQARPTQREDASLVVEDDQARRELRMARAQKLGVTDPRFLPPR